MIVSYDFQNKVRDLTAAFLTLVAKYPTFLSLILVGAAAKSTKIEWLNDAMSMLQSAIGSFDTTGTGTGINVASTSGFAAGDILRVEAPTGADRVELVKVASVDSATELTVVRQYGGTTGATFVIGDIVKLVAKPKNENTDPASTAGREPSTDYNYTQIFDRTARVSRTMSQVNEYGIENMLDYQVGVKLKELMWEINSAAIFGRRVQRSSSENGTLGGILQFMEGGNAETTGGAISKIILNNMLESIFNDGGMSNNYAIVCAENQARKISAFNTSGANPIVMTSPENRSAGGYISSFVGDLPVQNGFLAKVVVEPNFPRDKVAVVDLNAVELAPLQSMNDKDATPNGADYFQRRVLAELSLRVLNGQQKHALATGLTL